MTDAEIESTNISFTYDDHGHPELGNVSKAHIFNLLLQRKLKELNISVKSSRKNLAMNSAVSAFSLRPDVLFTAWPGC